MEITLQYFDDCANWQTTDGYLKTLIDEHSLDAEVRYQLIDTPEAAAEQGFRGSPTVLVDGRDPFADRDAPVGLACRIYQTETGPAGSPSLAQLERALHAGSPGT
jgi:hypothetical protein